LRAEGEDQLGDAVEEGLVDVRLLVDADNACNSLLPGGRTRSGGLRDVEERGDDAPVVADLVFGQAR